MTNHIVNVDASIGIAVGQQSPISTIANPSVMEAVNSQFANHVESALLGGIALTNLVGAPAPAPGTPVVSFAPLQFAVNATSGSLSTGDTILALNELLAAVESLGGAPLRVGQSIQAFPGLEYKLIQGEWKCCATFALEADRGGSYVRASFAAVVNGVQYPANFHITVGWGVPTSTPILLSTDD